MEGRYMMATKAVHLMGDISREKPDLCVIYGEDEENFIGHWMTGLGYREVKFPKNSTRELTDEEKKKWHDRQIGVEGGFTYTVRTLPE